MSVERLGLDPEVAIISHKTGKGRSALMFLKEKKVFKFWTDNKGNSIKGSEVERDGAAIEIRSIVPSACRDNIIPYFAEAMRDTSLRLEGWKKGVFKLSTTPLFELDTLSLKDPPEDVLEFGCRPDCDAYTLEIKDPTIPEGDRTRYTGGHIHASTMGIKNNLKQQAALAMLFDYFVVVPMVAILGDKFADGEAQRRKYYGQPGSFRYDNKLDKIEFRTLSGRLQLHPTIMGWCLGMVKSLALAPLKNWKPDYIALLKKVMTKIPTELVYETILYHDYETAEQLSNKLFTYLPTYKVDSGALANRMSGGGKATTNPYFFEQSLAVFIEGRKEGLLWDDDLKFNWGLYKNFEAKHHSYWGVHQAFVGLLDDDIFPFNALLPSMWDKDVLQKEPVWTHPINGGESQYVKPGAAGWLQ